MNSHNGPWYEKYRPKLFSQVVLDPNNRIIFENILKKHYFPHLLFYGPPGVGKTTSAEALIAEYQRSMKQKPTKETVMYLNASDERGIDVIRNQIHQFVTSKNLFESGLKFVVLDEVDYMTKNAQQALKNVLQSCYKNVRFCLICNYICKIEESLKHEFICIRFNKLPSTEVAGFISSIAEKENMKVSAQLINTIERMYHSDIRSMINFLQFHQNDDLVKQNDLMNETVWETLHTMFLTKVELAQIEYWFLDISQKRNTDIRTCIREYFNYMIQNHIERTTPSFLNTAEILLHPSSPNPYMFMYFIHRMNREYACFVH